MQNPTPGMDIAITKGPFAGYSGLVKSVSGTTALGEIEFFGDKTTIKLESTEIKALNQVHSSPDELTAQSPFHVGDTVFIHESTSGQPDNIGQIGSIIAVQPRMQKCIVRLAHGEQPGTKAYDYFALSLIRPERRPPDDDYLRSITFAILMRGCEPSLTQWWQEQATTKTWSIEELPALHANYLALKAALDVELITQIERQQRLFQQAFHDLTHAQKVEKWHAEWYIWTAFRSDLRPHLGLTTEEKLLWAIFGGIGEVPEINTEDEDDRKDLPSGPALRERCETHVTHLGQSGYAYDATPFRPLSSPPLRPPLLDRANALAALQKEDEQFRPALISLATGADEQAVTTLLEKYTHLKSQEGFDPARWDRQEQLKIALLATQQEAAVLTVLHDLLRSAEYPPYRLQGVMLKGCASPFFWDKNPWQIRADETVQSAILRIWTPVTHYAPRFVSLLCERIIGLALVKREQSNAPSLVYLSLCPASSYKLQESGIARNQLEQTNIHTLLDWLDQGTLSHFVGDPPFNPNDDQTKHIPAFRLPLALRELYAIHGTLGNWSDKIVPPDGIGTLLSWFFDGLTEDEKNYYLNNFHMDNAGRFPDQFVMVAYDGSGNISVFDRDLLDERLDPQVANWDHATWQVGPRQPFWSWFDDYIPSLLSLIVA